MVGSENASSRSKRPGRRRAGSMASTRLVAPMTTTCPRLSSPSINASRVDTREECTWSTFMLRTGARPSISSKKMMEGCRRLASSNSSRSWRSASPTHLDRQSAPWRGEEAGASERREAQWRQQQRQHGSRHAGTQARRHAGTQARRHAGTQARRHAGTQAGPRPGVRGGVCERGGWRLHTCTHLAHEKRHPVPIASAGIGQRPSDQRLARACTSESHQAQR